MIVNDDDVLNANTHMSSEHVVPIFCVSNVMGTGLDLITKYLYVLSPGINNAEKERLEQEPVEFAIDEIFRVAGVGHVVGGLLTKGVLTEKAQVKIGPLQDGTFVPVTVQTIHRNRAPCRVVRAGQSASLSFHPHDDLPLLRTGMVIMSDYDDEEPTGTWFFQVRRSSYFFLFGLYSNPKTKEKEDISIITSRSVTLYNEKRACVGLINLFLSGDNFGPISCNSHLCRIPDYRTYR
jgi:hypothetical protein